MNWRSAKRCLNAGNGHKTITTTLLLYKHTIYLLIFIINAILINAATETSAISNNERKFGERLLPLQRKKAVRMVTAAGGLTNRHELLNKMGVAYKNANKTQMREHKEDQYDIELANISTTTTTTTTSLKIEAAAADRLEMSTEFFLLPNHNKNMSNKITATTAATIQTVSAKTRVVAASVPASRAVLIVAPQNGVNASAAHHPAVLVTSNYYASSGLRKEPWVVPVLVLASLTMLMMAAFEIFVLLKAWRTSPSRRHLFLGQMLLLGLFACACLAAIITLQPTLFSCGTLRFGVGVAYALVFAALLVKCVFLISLNGGVYLPAPYQGLLLLFAVLIQVAIGAQWLLTQPPELYTLQVPPASLSLPNYLPQLQMSSSGADVTSVVLVSLCKAEFTQLLFSLSYIFFLILFVAVLATKSRGIRDNYREATYIGLAIGGAIPIWFGWMLCGLVVNERHKDACVAFGLVATSATVFLVMFMPKGRQLAAMGKEGLYVEDREDQFSSLSRAGSGYSPSFFHFKPIKYGVMGSGCGGTAAVAANPGAVHISAGNGTISATARASKHACGQTNNINEGEF